MTTDRVKLDANGRPIYGEYSLVVKKSITFNGGTTNAIGDSGGTQNPFTIFTVTGDVMVDVFGVVKTDLVGDTATLAVGVTGATGALIAATTATGLDVNMGWRDTSVALAEPFTPRYSIIGGGLDIIGTVATADITAGVIDFYCFYYPLSDDGLVEAV